MTSWREHNHERVGKKRLVAEFFFLAPATGVLRPFCPMVDRLAGDKISQTFCVLPWIHRFTNIGGEHQVCCTAEEYHPAIPDADGRPLTIANCQDDQRIMNCRS